MIEAFRAERLRATEQAVLKANPSADLMGQAAFAVAQCALQHLPSPRPGRQVTLLVGTGNNGGDALFAGVLLRRRGIAVTAMLAGDRAHPAGLAALHKTGGRVVEADQPAPVREHALVQAELVIDGLVGLGARGPLSSISSALLDLANQRPIIAVDLPSGIDPDTGQVLGPAIHAKATLTIGAPSPGLLVARTAGRLHLAECGLRPAGAADVIALQDADAVVPQADAGSNKFSSGVLGIVAGSPAYPGAAVLSTAAAVRLRPGLVRYAGPVAAAVLAHSPEVVAAARVEECGRVQAWLAGPGMGTDGRAARELRAVLDSGLPVVLDADALTLLAADPALLRHRPRGTAILTPHAGEFARLWPDIDLDDRLGAAQQAAQRSGQVVLLKGDRTVIAEPAGRTAVNQTGCPALATAGSGDVLGGVIGSLLATGLGPFRAAAIGAHLHGRAGERLARHGTHGALALVEHLRDRPQLPSPAAEST